MRYLFTLTLAAIALWSIAQNGEPLSLSLEEALAQAMTNNKSIANSKLDIEYANTQVDEIKAQGLPQVNASGSFSHSYKVPTSLLPGEIAGGAPGSFIPVQFGVPFTVQAGVGLNQLLFDGTFFLGLKAASEFVNISKLSASASEIDVREAVTKAYYMALISDQNLGQLDESLVNIKKMQSETEQLYKAGFAEKLDVDRLVLSVSNLEISINQLQNQAQLAKQLLLNSMGVDVNQKVELTSKLPTEVLSLDDLGSSFNPENRIEMKMLDQQQTLNELSLKRYKVGYLPSLYGNFNFGGNTMSSEFGDLGNDWFGNGAYGLSLSVPIFDGFYKKAKTDQVKIEMQKTENSKEQLTLGMNLQVSQAKTNYANALKKLELQENSKTLAESIYNTTKIKFKEGVGSSFEMITAESELTQSRTNYLNALYELNVTKIDLNKALGTL